jgi:hypothetical protein
VESDVRPSTLFLVTGACLRAERFDRPLAARIRAAAELRLRARLQEEPDVVILSDVWYLNSRELHRIPTISVGGPSVNHLTAFWQRKLPHVLLVENVFQTQMDLDQKQNRCSVWGMDHDNTVEAVETFITRNHLDRFLECFPKTIA